MLALNAQNQPTNIVERIQTQSGGEIQIDIPDDILRDLLETPQPKVQQPHAGQRPGQGAARPAKNGQGFRIQIFGDGRNPATLRTRATARANAVCSRFPKYRGQIYSFSKAPNWYTRVGNFRTREEANAALAELRRAFPAFASEMRVVQSAINAK